MNNEAFHGIFLILNVLQGLTLKQSNIQFLDNEQIVNPNLFLIIA